MISVTELSEQLKVRASAQHIVILDCRFSLADTTLGEEQYHKGHIPGAYYLHLDRDLSGEIQAHGGRHPLPNPTTLADKLRNTGIDTHTQVVVYDDSRFAFAARAWWLLRYLGHTNVHVLDGGFQAWRKEGLAIDRRTPVVRAGKFTPKINDGWTVGVENVKKISTGTVAATLIDAREPRRYQGLEEPIDPIAGHIPGALNFPWQQVSDDHGHVLSENKLRELWEPILQHRTHLQDQHQEQQQARQEELVVYCGSGVTACVDLLALAITGREAKLYPGSWSDWCSYPETPKATKHTAEPDKQ